jgi:hypothetical protein
MPDDMNKPEQRPEPRVMTREQQAQERAREVARESAAEPETKMPEDVPGGRYLVDGVLVDSEGKPLDGKKD